MDLRTFVRQCLQEIVCGVSDASESDEVKSAGGIVNPKHTYIGGELAQRSIQAGEGMAQMVDFDVAVTAQEGAGTKATIGVVAGIFGAGTQGHLSQETTSVSRIRFSVPVLLPRPKP